MSLQYVSPEELAERSYNRPHRYDESAPARARVLDALRAGEKPCRAARAAGYQRTILSYWRRKAEGFREADQAARQHARFTRLAAVVRRVEHGQTITQALADEGRGTWWFYNRLPEFPDLYRRLYAVRKDRRPQALAERVATMIANLDAGMFFGEACRAAGMSRTNWVGLKDRQPELHAAILEARARNDIGPQCRARGRWGKREAQP